MNHNPKWDNNGRGIDFLGEEPEVIKLKNQLKTLASFIYLEKSECPFTHIDGIRAEEVYEKAEAILAELNKDLP